MAVISEATDDALGDYYDDEQWVGWSYWSGDRKVPLDPWATGGTDEPASVDDDFTWADAPRAAQMADHRGWEGVGFIFTDHDPLVGIDLDDCRDPESAEFEPWAREVIERIASYTEVSPSGTGAKIWCTGADVLGRDAYKDTEQGVEVYTSRRFFTVTGEHIGWTPARVTDAPDGLGWLVETYELDSLAGEDELEVGFDGDDAFPVEPTEWVPDALDTIDPDCGYDRWVAIGQALHDGFEGSTEGLEIWRRWSRRGDKFAENTEGELRRKWDGFGSPHSQPRTLRTLWAIAEDYGWQWTGETDEAFSLDTLTDSLQAARESAEGAEGADDEGDDSESGAQSDIATIEWHSAGELWRDKSDYEPHLVEPCVIGKSDLVMLFGPPKSMKSMAALAMCRQWAAGEPWLDLEPRRPLRICYLNFELKRDNLRRRLHQFQMPSGGVDKLDENLWITSRLIGQLDNGFAVDLLNSVKKQTSADEHGLDLFVVDPLVDLYSGESENDNQQVKQFIQNLKAVVSLMDEDAATMMVHHASKMSRDERHSEPFRALRGGSAFRGSYDTGMGLAWQSKDRQQLQVAFECRNGPGLDNRHLVFEDGKFHQVDEDYSAREAGQVQGRQWDNERARKAHIICERLRIDAEEGRVWTAKGFADRYGGHKDYNLGAPATVRSYLRQMAEKWIIGYFDADAYGGPGDLHANANGHLCCMNMQVGQKDTQYGVELTSIEEAQGVVEYVRPDRVSVAGYHEPQPVEDVDEFRGLQAVETAYKEMG